MKLRIIEEAAHLASKGIILLDKLLLHLEILMYQEDKKRKC